MLEVGKTYETKQGEEFTCIAVNDTHAWLCCGANETAYVWTQDGKAMLGPSYDITTPAREFWIGAISGIVSTYPQKGMIHVREVLPE